MLDPQQQYHVIRHDRKDKVGGGVCALISRDLKYIEIPVTNCHRRSSVIVFDIVVNSSKMCFVLVYRPPYHCVDSIDDADDLSQLLSTLSRHSKPICVLGDFNCSNVDWSYRNSPTGSIDTIVYNMFCYNGFQQCVNEPTRNDNVLDIVCINNPILLEYLHVLPPFNGSDHDGVSFGLRLPGIVAPNVSSNQPAVSKMVTKYSWREADFASLGNYLLGIEWTDILTTNFSPDSLWSSFSDILNHGISLYVPSKSYMYSSTAGLKRSQRRRQPDNIKKLQRKKLLQWRKWRLDTSNVSQKIKYNKLCAEFKRAIRIREIENENKIIDDNNLGSFYKFVNQKLKTTDRIGALTDEKGDLVVDDRGRANVLNRFFSSVCTVDDGNTLPDRTPYTQNVLNNINFDEIKIINAARNIKTKNKYAPDLEGYPIILITKLITILSVPLSLIFNSFISVGRMPSNWKRAVVTPIFKKGLPSLPQNYRPISCTSIFCKLMERVIANEISQYLDRSNLLNSAQHGFLRGKSTTTNLLETVSEWTVTLENHNVNNVTTIFIDFQKAFDSVSHKKLITKLKLYGISGNVLNLIQDFLADRTQVTRVNNEYSYTSQVTSGVVQGSCLGPLLFIIFINDLPDIFIKYIRSKIYADDYKLYTEIVTYMQEFMLQHSINQLIQWSHDCQLPISFPKCSAMHVHRKASKQTNKPTYFIERHQIELQTCVKDLGVLIDDELTFSPHINSIVHKASCRSILIFKSFVSRNTKTLVRAFITYVRPILEYCSPIWTPSTIKDTTAIESVQRRFTKKLPGLFNYSYDERLQKLGLERLEARRIRADLILCYKILFGIYKTTIAFELYSNDHNTRGHPYKIRLPQIKTNTHKHSFYYRVPKIWNELPTTINFSSLENFVNSVNQVDFTKYFNTCQ